MGLGRDLRPSDRVILVQFTSTGAEGRDGFSATLQAIIATNRGWWASWDGPVLTEATAVAGAMQWHLDIDGSQSPMLLIGRCLSPAPLTSAPRVLQVLHDDQLVPAFP